MDSLQYILGSRDLWQKPIDSSLYSCDDLVQWDREIV